MSEIQAFEFDRHEVRVVLVDGEPWWVLKDVCDVLGIGNPSEAAARLSDDQKGIRIVETLRGSQRALTVSEAGLYRVLFASRKPQAERFQTWVAEKVRDLRRNGVALAGPDAERNAALLAEIDDPIIQQRLTQIQHGRRLDALEAENVRLRGLVGEIEDGYVTVVGWANARRVQIDERSAAGVGKAAAALCRERGIRIGSVKSEKWGTVNTYPESVLDEVAA